MTPPDDETPLPAAVPHHEADPTSQVERSSADELELEIDPDELLATRPHQRLEPADPETSDLFPMVRPADADDFEAEEKTPPPRFLQQPGPDHDQTLPRDRQLQGDDEEDTEA